MIFTSSMDTRAECMPANTSLEYQILSIVSKIRAKYKVVTDSLLYY